MNSAVLLTHFNNVFSSKSFQLRLIMNVIDNRFVNQRYIDMFTIYNYNAHNDDNPKPLIDNLTLYVLEYVDIICVIRKSTHIEFIAL